MDYVEKSCKQKGLAGVGEIGDTREAVIQSLKEDLMQILINLYFLTNKQR